MGTYGSKRLNYKTFGYFTKIRFSLVSLEARVAQENQNQDDDDNRKNYRYPPKI